MRGTIALLLSLTVAFSAGVYAGENPLSGSNVRYGGEGSEWHEGITFYTFNPIFDAVTVVTEKGDVFSGTFVTYGTRSDLGDLLRYKINFPKTDGKNAIVVLYFRARNLPGVEHKRKAVFKLADYSYVEHHFYLGVTGGHLKMDSNFGPVEEGIPRVSRWTFPQDDITHSSSAGEMTPKQKEVLQR